METAKLQLTKEVKETVEVRLPFYFKIKSETDVTYGRIYKHSGETVSDNITIFSNGAILIGLRKRHYDSIGNKTIQIRKAEYMIALDGGIELITENVDELDKADDPEPTPEA